MQARRLEVWVAAEARMMARVAVIRAMAVKAVWAQAVLAVSMLLLWKCRAGSVLVVSKMLA